VLLNGREGARAPFKAFAREPTLQRKAALSAEFGNAELVEMGMPGPLIGETALFMFGQAGDHGGGSPEFPSYCHHQRCNSLCRQ